MKISRALNLTFPIETDNGTIHVHSVPISRETFKLYFDIIGQTVARIHAKGLNVVAGPNIAALMLRQVAEAEGRWDGPDGVKNGLLAEIRRLTNVVVPGPQGWATLPLDEACKRDLLDEAAADAVEGAACFFSCASCVHSWQRESLLAILTISGMLSVWRAQITFSNCTEFANSLETSTPRENSGATATTLSVPS
jgi:hypothetical protein